MNFLIQSGIFIDTSKLGNDVATNIYNFLFYFYILSIKHDVLLNTYLTSVQSS